jgi:uncharacterized lipoprotein YajG
LPQLLVHKLEQQLLKKVEVYLVYFHSQKLAMKTITSTIAFCVMSTAVFMLTGLVNSPIAHANSVQEELNRTNATINDANRFLRGQEQQRNNRVSSLNYQCQHGNTSACRSLTNLYRRENRGLDRAIERQRRLLRR